MRRTSYLAIIIVILAVAVRFIQIDQPFVDHWSWRQSDVAAIARNYFQNGFHFAYPQIDWAGGELGYVGTEFPILPFAAALCYKTSGIHEWIGRVQAVILFALSLPFFFLLVRKTFGEIAAVWSLGFYSFAPIEIMAMAIQSVGVGHSPRIGIPMSAVMAGVRATKAAPAVAPRRLTMRP